MAKSLENFGKRLVNATADLLSSSDFINRTIGMANSYEDIMFIVQALGREPISLLGKDYLYIFDHVRRNYNMGSNVMNPYHNDCPKFTFYKEKPTVRFADPYNDPMNLLSRWVPNINFESTSQRNILFSYAESDDDYTNNKEINASYGIENANPGVNFGGISSFSNVLPTCDLIKKTNDNFNHGKYKTLIARFHTNSMDSKDKNDITQTAISEQYGMSHGRNLLKKYDLNEINNGYDNPYCRVWTYHHQYNQLSRAIRPFDLQSARLDKYGVLNYRNGMVNIAPTAKLENYFHSSKDKQIKEITIKKCMFSIENLAWKTENVSMNEYDKYGLSPEQKGPLGGRIMWFPPYDLKFNESVNVNWNPNQFIGRGEKIYTYTDTERRGNLSFTLLIDHPSILDYWTGHKRNGMKNQGKDLILGNGGGVDEINNQENTLLRFFAGCEILSAKPQEFEKTVKKRKSKSDSEKTPIKDAPDSDEHKPIGKQRIYCFAFYPNNYSGMDDAPSKGGKKVNAIHYLLNGIGTQRHFNTLTKKGEDFGVDMNNNIVINDGAKDGYGGYEMRDGKGVSIAKDILKSEDAINRTYEGASETVQFLTDENGNKYEANYGDVKDFTSPYLTKYSWDGAISQKNAVKKDGSINQDWYHCRYYYRVDSNTLSQKLLSPESYIDRESYGYNAKGIYSSSVIKNLETEFNINFENENAQVVSLTDMYLALEGNNSGIFDDLKNSSKVSYVKDILSNKDKYNISITFYGNASSQGNNKSKRVNAKRNTSLSKQRGLTLKKWLMANNFPNIDKAEYKDFSHVQQGGNKDDVDDPITKLWRSAYVVIDYELSDIDDASLAETSLLETAATESGDTNLDKTVKMPIPNGLNSNEIKNPLLEMNKKRDDAWNSQFQDKIDSKLDILNGKADNVVDDVKDVDEASLNDGVKEEGSATIKGIVERYDNEGEFFELLEKNDPFMHHLITDKIRYFDPAFHSISPEGFNARLTFLHQCTRQGSTVGGSDNQIGNTAYNLAFGRPPVCVLRLGDFFNTKIIINSINIQYETPQWDLNPEGIGVMPVFASVNLDFVFLGGSDLSGPISRLQNAVSFNYYANTSVYDNRAEMVQYDEDGSGHEVKFRPFSYPDMMHNGEPRQEKKKGVVDIKEDLRWMEEFYNGVNVRNAETMQTDERITTFDKNFK